MYVRLFVCQLASTMIPASYVTHPKALLQEQRSGNVHPGSV